MQSTLPNTRAGVIALAAALVQPTVAEVAKQLRTEAASMRKPEGDVVAELAAHLATDRLNEDRLKLAVDRYAQWMADAPPGLNGPALLREAMRDAIRVYLGVTP